MSCCKSLCAFCKDLYNSCFCKVIRFLVFLIIINIANVVSVWMLFHSVAEAKEGLVFGHPGDSVKYALLVFSIFGTLTFFSEVYWDWQEIFHDNENEAHRAYNIWFVEFPQMVINLVITVCREEAISYYLLFKASVIVLGAFIRIVKFCIKWCTKGIECNLKCFGKMTGLIVILGCAIAIFIVTQTERNSDGSLNFKVPHNIVEREFDDKKYFTNVSIYFSHSYFDYETNPTTESINLIRLLSIHDLQNSKTDRAVAVKYDTTHTNFLIQIDGKSEQCFTINNGTVSEGTSCSSHVPNPSGQFAFTFHYVDASFPRLLFGDITYNMKTGNNTNCEPLDFSVFNNMDAHIDNPSSALMRYYRTKPNVTEESNIRQTSNTSYEFYRQSDLVNIENIWKLYCKSTGSRAPHRDESLTVQCL